MRFSQIILLAMTMVGCIANDAWAQSDFNNRCDSRAWINAYHPEQPVFPKPTDRCRADEKMPLFTREGTLACPTLEVFQLAYNSMEHGWTYVPTAGVADQPGDATGAPVSAKHFGCTIYGDGIAVAISRESFAEAETNIGWISRNNIRNAPATENENPSASSLRPKLCDKHGKHCVYTDVKPYEPVR